jgi:hypothetical protein
MFTWSISPEEFIGSLRMRHGTEYATIFARDRGDSLYRTIIFIGRLTIFIDELERDLTIFYESRYLEFICKEPSFRMRCRYHIGPTISVICLRLVLGARVIS